MVSVLLVEDDVEFAALLSGFLTRQDMQVSVAGSVAEAELRLAQFTPELILLDVMLPGEDGLSFCRRLRPDFEGTLVMLTSLDSDLNQILGLELGADDYVLKTTPPAVLLARLRAQLRRKGGNAASVTVASRAPLVFGALRIDPLAREVWLGGERVTLTSGDFDLLWMLASAAGEVLSRESLFKALRGIEYDGVDRSIDVAISRLRKRLGDDAGEPERIKTVRHRGYLFSPTGW